MFGVGVCVLFVCVGSCVVTVTGVVVQFGQVHVDVCCFLLVSVVHVVWTQFLQELQRTDPL